MSSAAGRALSSYHRKVPGVCLECGAGFVGLVGRLYCSSYCRVKHWRRANRPQVDSIHLPYTGADYTDQTGRWERS